MRYAIIPGLVISTSVAAACGGHAASDADSIASSEAPIEGGRPINDPMNPVSSLIPMSTVSIATDTTTSSGDKAVDWCTGVILSTTKVLTAAHCGATQYSRVYFYPTTPGPNADQKQGSMTTVSAPGATQPGMSCTPTTTGKTHLSGCYSSTSGVASHYADLAVLTLNSPVQAPWKPVWLAPRDSFAARQAVSSGPPQSWAAGTGQMNWRTLGCTLAEGGTVDGGPETVLNKARVMQWLPVFKLTSNGDGSFDSANLFGDLGDSGGPVFQYANGGKNLVVVGILSTGDGSCTSSKGSNAWTDVTYAANYDWLVAQGATAAPKTASFGAAL